MTESNRLYSSLLSSTAATMLSDLDKMVMRLISQGDTSSLNSLLHFVFFV